MVYHDDDGYKLFVGHLPHDVTEDELDSVFRTYGVVSKVHMLTKVKKGDLFAAFVFYRDKEAAEDAIHVLHDQYRIRAEAEKPITVKWAFDKNADLDLHKLFVGNLPSDVTEDELMQVFETYGKVRKVHFAANETRDGMKGALVMYEDLDSAEDAIKVLDQIYKIRKDAEHPISVSWAKLDARHGSTGGHQERWSDSRAESRGASSRHDRHERRADDKWSDSHRDVRHDDKVHENDPFKLFVGNLPEDIEDNELHQVFSTYGNVRKVHLIEKPNASGMRCAFVFYEKDDDCEDAIKVLDGVYKIREDAEEPISVRWANSILNKGKGEEKGKGKGRASDDRGGSWQQSRGWEDKPSRRQDQHWDDRNRDRERDRDWDRGRERPWQSKTSSWKDNGWKDTSWQDNGRERWKREDSSNWRDNPRERDDNHRRTPAGGDRNDYHHSKRGGDGHARGDGRGHSRNEDDGTRLFVGNLPEGIKESALEYVFGTYGKVGKIHLMSRPNERGLVAAFVDYMDLDDADTAIESLNGKYEIRQGSGYIQVRRANARSKPY